MSRAPAILIRVVLLPLALGALGAPSLAQAGAGETVSIDTGLELWVGNVTAGAFAVHHPVELGVQVEADVLAELPDWSVFENRPDLGSFFSLPYASSSAWTLFAHPYASSAALGLHGPGGAPAILELIDRLAGVLPTDWFLTPFLDDGYFAEIRALAPGVGVSFSSPTHSATAGSLIAAAGGSSIEPPGHVGRFHRALVSGARTAGDVVSVVDRIAPHPSVEWVFPDFAFWITQGPSGGGGSPPPAPASVAAPTLHSLARALLVLLLAAGGAALLGQRSG